MLYVCTCSLLLNDKVVQCRAAGALVALTITVISMELYHQYHVVDQLQVVSTGRVFILHSYLFLANFNQYAFALKAMKFPTKIT